MRNIVIPGARNAAQAQGNAAASDLPLLNSDQMAAVRDIYDRLIAPAVRAYRPDILVTQTGCDTHHADPLTEAAGRNFIKWPYLNVVRPPGSVFDTPATTTWTGQIDAMKNWLTTRMAWIDGQFPTLVSFSLPEMTDST